MYNCNLSRRLHRIILHSVHHISLSHHHDQGFGQVNHDAERHSTWVTSLVMRTAGTVLEPSVSLPFNHMTRMAVWENFVVQLTFLYKSYVYWTVHHLDSWIKIDQLDVTCFIISLFTVQRVSNVSTSVFRSLRLIVDLFPYAGWSTEVLQPA